MSARRKARRAAKKQAGNFPGVSPKSMKKAMGQMDIKNIENVEEVIIRIPSGELVLKDPEVQVVKMGGQEIYTISASGTERRSQPSKNDDLPQFQVSEDDVRFIVEKAGVSEAKAREALKKSKGDLAAAFLSVT